MAIIVLAAAAANAQFKGPQPTYTYKQKKDKEKLESVFADLAVQSDTGTYKNNMPVVPLTITGAPAGATAPGKLYNMQPDNMPVIKPNPTNAVTPNAFNGMQMMVPNGKP